MARKKKPDYFKTFCKVSKAFGSTFSKQELLELVVVSAVETMNAKAACLFMADEKTDAFVPVAQTGLSENYLHTRPSNACKIVETIIKGGHLYIPDATSDPRVENHDMKKAEGIASILDVPVIVQDKAIGILALYTAKLRTFDQEEIDFMTALAEQGGRAIEYARLLDRTRKNSRLLLELIASINSSLDIRNILHSLTAETCKALGMKAVSIRLINEDSGTLDLITTYGLSETFLNKGPVYTEKSISDALKGKSVAIQDVATDSRIQYREETLKEGIISMLCVPIKARENVIGVIRLFSAVKRDFPEDLLLLVEALAHAGGLAIQNASMYLKLEQDKENLEKDIWAHRSWF